MSGVTPDYVLQQAINSNEIIVETKDFRKYMLDLNGWFMWWGVAYDMRGKGVGVGLTRITATPRYLKKDER